MGSLRLISLNAQKQKAEAAAQNARAAGFTMPSPEEGKLKQPRQAEMSQAPGLPLQRQQAEAELNLMLTVDIVSFQYLLTMHINRLMELSPKVAPVAAVQGKQARHSVQLSGQTVLRTLPGTNRCGASAIGVAVLVRDFAASQGDDFDVVVVGAGVSGLTAAHRTSALSSQPRNMGPFDPEETADMELAPRGWARQIRPVDHRTTDVKRLRPDEAELAEAKRALRGVRPGDWNSEAFAHYKKKLTKEGRWLALPGLVDMVRRTSDEALKAGGYCLPKNKTAQVRLPQKPSVQWVSMESCTEPDPCQGVVPPPLVVSHKTPLEAAGVLGKHFEGHPLIVTFEATEFDTGAESEMKKGQILEGEARGLAQHEMFNCTNLVFSSRAATLLCAKARQSPQERLNAWHDPGVIVADNVVLFRGPAEDGYPFLSQEEQLNLRVLVAGRALKRLGPR
ncbi:unnamed protein product [Durusdinium trenchii]|uniref:Glucose-methanol-choline oxidoreductase N-terminal domain-containing protein n=1 Tax=Durusdinium trenchii TaxID=1381693 RepID=A0ABP0MGC4_9DINO